MAGIVGGFAMLGIFGPNDAIGFGIAGIGAAPGTWIGFGILMVSSGSTREQVDG